MASSELKQKIRDALKRAYFNDADDLVDVSDGVGDDIHVVVVSHKFDGQRMREKNDLIWSVLSRELAPDEWGKVTLSIGTTPAEIKASAPRSFPQRLERHNQLLARLLPRRPDRRVRRPDVHVQQDSLGVTELHKAEARVDLPAIG